MSNVPEAAALESQAERWETRCGTGSIVWRTWGRGAPLLLLHGAPGAWTHWVRNVAALSAHYRVIVPDLPGYGESALPDPNTVDGAADALAAGLAGRLMPGDRLAVVGFSFGGVIGALLARRLGPQVRMLLLSGTGAMGLPIPDFTLLRIPPEAPWEEVERVHRANLGVLMLADPARIDAQAVAMQIAIVRQARFRTGDLVRSRLLLDVLPGVSARLAGMWGERDPFASGDPWAPGRVLEGVQRGAPFRLIPGAGHWAIYEAPGTANAALLDLLAPT